jgi:hypothetical protein
MHIQTTLTLKQYSQEKVSLGEEKKTSGFPAGGHQSHRVDPSSETGSLVAKPITRWDLGNRLKHEIIPWLRIQMHPMPYSSF